MDRRPGAKRPGKVDDSPTFSRRQALSAVALLAVPNLLAGCLSRSGTTAAPENSPTVTFTPTDGATGLVPTAPIGVRVRDGWFQRIALTNAAGRTVAGSLNRDRTSYTVTEPLGYGATYTWSGSVVGRNGKAVAVTGSVATVTPSQVVNGWFQLNDGQTVGVAAPVILQFDAAIADKAAVERALTVTTTPPTEGGWAWLPDEVGGARAHWRSREYFAPGTTVHVDAKLYGVDFGDGSYGAGDMTLDFDIGRRQVVKATSRATSRAVASTSSPRSIQISTCPTPQPAT